MVSRLPDWLRHNRTWGMANWKWPGMVLLSVLGSCVMIVLYRQQFWQTNRFFDKQTSRFINRRYVLYFLTMLFPVAAMLVPLGVEYAAIRYLTIRGYPLYVTSFVTLLIALMASVAVVFAVTKRVAELIIASPRINPEGLNAQLIRICAKLFSVVAVTIIFLVGGQYLGIPVATLLASAGIGGIALALGAQDTLRTLFGTLMLMADKPFRVGDRIMFRNYDGVVEDIGLRSTKLRLLTGHQVIVPNDELSRTDIENVGRRPHIRRDASIHIPLDTPRHKLDRAGELIRAALENHEGMDPEHPPRVYFDEFNQGSFNLRFFYWYSPPNYWDYLKFAETLNLRICEAFEREGIQFSMPTRVSYWKDDLEKGPLDVQLTSAADATRQRISLPPEEQVSGPNIK